MISPGPYGHHQKPKDSDENRSRPCFAIHLIPSAENAQRSSLDVAGDIVVGFTDTLVAADLGILPLALLHEGLKFSVVGLGDCLGLHLDCEPATRRLDTCPDIENGLLESRDALILVQALASEDIQRRGNQLYLDLVFFVVTGFGAPGAIDVSTQSQSTERQNRLPKGRLDSVNAVVAKACHLDVCAELCRLRGQPLGNVALQFLLDRRAGEFDVGPNIRVPKS